MMFILSSDGSKHTKGVAAPLHKFGKREYVSAGLLQIRKGYFYPSYAPQLLFAVQCSWSVCCTVLMVQCWCRRPHSASRNELSEGQWTSLNQSSFHCSSQHYCLMMNRDRGGRLREKGSPITQFLLIPGGCSREPGFSFLPRRHRSKGTEWNLMELGNRISYFHWVPFMLL